MMAKLPPIGRSWYCNPDALERPMYATLYDERGDDDFEKIATFMLNGDREWADMPVGDALRGAEAALEGELGTPMIMLHDDPEPPDVYCPHYANRGECPND